MAQQEVILLTGGAKRIGKAIALHMANLGHSVVIHYKSAKADATELAQEINSKGGKAVTLSTDLSNETLTKELIHKAAEAIGSPITCLINNASQYEPDDIQNTTRESWDQHMEVNLRAPFVLSQCFQRALPKGIKGNIINIIDQRVKNLDPTFSSYTLSKVGLWTLTQTMAQALAPRIRVNGIGPGPVFQSIHQTETEFINEANKTPLGKATDAHDIAKTIEFILNTPSITGQLIVLDGGQHLS